MRFYTKEWFYHCQTAEPGEPQLRQPVEAYSAVRKKQNIPDTLWDKLRYHDAQLLQIQMKDDGLHLWMEDMGWGNEHLQLVKPDIVLWEEPLTDMVWIYEELYRIPAGYELHVLFQDWKSVRLAELTVRCADIVIKRQEE